MIKKIGYACINETLKPKKFRTCRLRTVLTKGIAYLQEIIMDNLNLTNEILQWNLKNNIYMYRASSDLMPLVTHPDILAYDAWRWYEDERILESLKRIRAFVVDNGIRLSMHPDQYTVINSNRDSVVRASIEYLEYHQKLLEKMGGSDMIIHTGGVYGDKEAAMQRFIKVYKSLTDDIKVYLRLENDDKSYTIYEVLEISYQSGVPIIFDYHHHRCLSDEKITPSIIDSIESTWQGKRPKMHISSGREHSKDLRHHDYIMEEDCRILEALYKNNDVDVMVEAKKKELATMGVMNYFLRK